MKNQTELQYLSEEDNNRARLPGGGRKKASEELGINMREWVTSKRAHHERVLRKMIRAMEKQMYATVSDSRDEEFVASAGRIDHSLRRNNVTCRRQILSRRIAKGWEPLIYCFKQQATPQNVITLRQIWGRQDSEKYNYTFNHCHSRRHESHWMPTSIYCSFKFVISRQYFWLNIYIQKRNKNWYTRRLTYILFIM